MQSKLAPQIRDDCYRQGTETGKFSRQAQWILNTFLALGWASDEDVYNVLLKNPVFMAIYPKFGRQTVPARRNELFNSLAFLAQYEVQERPGSGDTEFLIRPKRKPIFDSKGQGVLWGCAIEK